MTVRAEGLPRAETVDRVNAISAESTLRFSPKMRAIKSAKLRSRIHSKDFQPLQFVPGFIRRFHGTPCLHTLLRNCIQCHYFFIASAIVF